MFVCTEILIQLIKNMSNMLLWLQLNATWIQTFFKPTFDMHMYPAHLCPIQVLANVILVLRYECGNLIEFFTISQNFHLLNKRWRCAKHDFHYLPKPYFRYMILIFLFDQNNLSGNLDADIYHTVKHYTVYLVNGIKRKVCH